MADGAVRDHTVGVRLSPHERAVLDGLVAESGADSPAALFRRILQAVAETTAGREALPIVLAHLDDAERETARREALVADPARWSGQVPAGELWESDPGVTVDVGGVSTALPNGEVHVVRARLRHAIGAERTAWERHGPAHRIKTLVSQARHARSEALRAVLSVDTIGGMALGWADPNAAGKVLGRDTFHPARDPRRFRGPSIPVAVVIGAGESEMAARQSAHAAGFDRQTRAAAGLIEVSAGVVEVVERLLPSGPVDLNAIIAQARYGTEETE